MLRSRVIPSLLLNDGGLIKTKKFEKYKYIGDPINAIKIFNEKSVDELCIFDIGCTVNSSPIDYKLLKNIAVESNMPLCYGGGIKSVNDATDIISLGFEKVSISSILQTNKEIIHDISEEIGSQSVVVTLDIKEIQNNEYRIFFNQGRYISDFNLFDLIREIEDLGAGELILNFIDRDGMRKGYDIDFASEVKKLCKIPLTILGGAGSMTDIKELLSNCSPIGAAAGSIFVFKGSLDAVLINYDKL